jgi:hypothetical protein
MLVMRLRQEYGLPATAKQILAASRPEKIVKVLLGMSEMS